MLRPAVHGRALAGTARVGGHVPNTVTALVRSFLVQLDREYPEGIVSSVIHVGADAARLSGAGAVLPWPQRSSAESAVLVAGRAAALMSWRGLQRRPWSSRPGRRYPYQGRPQRTAAGATHPRVDGRHLRFHARSSGVCAKNCAERSLRNVVLRLGDGAGRVRRVVRRCALIDRVVRALGGCSGQECQGPRSRGLRVVRKCV